MKDKKVKLRTKIFRMSLILSFAIFLTLFMSNKYGYYEYKKHEQVSLTAEQIKQFEEDVRQGKYVDLEDYLSNTNKNYQTKLSQAGLNLSNGIADMIKKGVESFFASIDKMVSETS